MYTTTTQSSTPTSTINPGGSNNSNISSIFSGDHPLHKSFVVSMSIAIIIAVIFIGFIIKKLVFYKSKVKQNALLDSMASSNISEYSSSYDLQSSKFNATLTESNLENNNSLLLIDMEQSNITNSINGDETTISEITNVNSNLTGDIIEPSNYIPNNSVIDLSDDNSSIDIDLELPSSKTDVNWEECMR
ncbi:hypothetical protein GLOIN_2v1684704 [Rhizophagus clarus]|nr:hypothetical protein GLOIN_2v1684704 [Rhizophagus clarus]